MTRGDLLVLIAAGLLIPYLYLAIWGGDGEAEVVRVWTEGGEARLLPLDHDGEHRVEGALGTSLIEIRDRRVRFKASPCQNQVCVHSGWLNRPGETAACLPNRVVVQVEGKERDYDAVNF